MKNLLLILMSSFAVAAPNCVIRFGIGGGTAFNAANQTRQFNNNAQGCYDWRIVYNSQGFSALSLVVESAPDVAGSPGSWVTFTSAGVTNPIQGANPNTDTGGASTELNGSAAWVRVRVASVTGSGQINGVLFGCIEPGCSTSSASAGGGGGIPSGTITPVNDGDFSWVNQQTASYAIQNKTVVLTVPQLAGDNLDARMAVWGPTTPRSVIIGLSFMAPASINNGAGIVIRDSGGGTMLAVQIDGNLGIIRCISGTMTSWSGFTSTGTRYGETTFMQARDDGTNTAMSVSSSGLPGSFTQVCTIADASLTANQIGFYVQSENFFQNTTLNVFSFVPGA